MAHTEENSFRPKELLEFQLERQVKNLYKGFLTSVEDICFDNDIPQEKYQRIRKRVLDAGNDCVRSLKEDVGKFEVTLKTKA
jgi:hypothetical protein